MEFKTAQWTNQRLATYCRIEQWIYAQLGEWVTADVSPSVRLLLAELSDHAGWRAQRWFESLPIGVSVGEPTPTEVVGHQNAAQLNSESDFVEFTAMVEAVVIGFQRDHLLLLDDVSARPLRRILEISVADLERDARIIASWRGESGPKLSGSLAAMAPQFGQLIAE